MSESTVWVLAAVLALAAVFALQIFICLKWGRWYILPALLVLPMVYCVYSYYQATGWDALGWFVLALQTAALLADALIAALVGMLVRKRKQKKAG